MKISFLNYNISITNSLIDSTWLSFKTYFQDNHTDIECHWNFPHNSSAANSIEELAQQVIDEQPDILGLSLYVWNIGVTFAVAEIIKKALPNVQIVIGGPHLEYETEDYFNQYPFVDFACEVGGYGEICLSEFIVQAANDKDFNSVPFLIIPTEDRTSYTKANKVFNKRTFKWPRYIYEKNEEYLDYMLSACEHRDRFVLMYEASRGCPYSCVYCEWGGGTASKVVFKPTEYVLEDLDYIFKKIKPNVFSFTDANFGIINRDVEIIEHLCKIKDEINCPKTIYFFGPSKSNKKNVYAIDKMLKEHNLMEEYKVPIQDLNDIVTENIKRTDDNWKLQLAEYKKIQAEVGGAIRAEMILGLPGATLDSFYESIAELYKDNIYSYRHIWSLLPTSPAAKQEYRDEYKLDTITASLNLRLSAAGDVNMYSETTDLVPNLVFDNRYAISTEIVVATYSYTREEYVEMLLQDDYVGIFEINGYLRYITTYMTEQGYNHGEFYRDFFNEVLDSDKYFSGIQLSILQSVHQQIRHKIHDNTTHVVDVGYVDSPSELPWKFKAKPSVLMNVLINLNREHFNQVVLQWLTDKFGYNEELVDLMAWNANMVKWIDYDPTGNHMFESKYNWHNWTKTGDLIKGDVLNYPKDTIYSTDDLIIDWHNVDMTERINKYFLVMCSDIYKYKLFHNMEVQNAENILNN